MTQQGIIRKILPGDLAEIEVTRQSACGHDCASCGGCGGHETQTLQVTARNQAQAKVGERVLVEGQTGRVLGMAVLVYVLPLILFFIGYAIPGALALGSAMRAIGGGIGFVLGIVCGMWYSRRMKQAGDIPFVITRKL